MASRNRKPKGDPLNTAASEGQSLAVTDASIFGRVGSSGREVVKEILIDKIWPDRSQPRRAIPNAVVGSKWDGNPETLGQIFNRWILMASHELDEEIAVGILISSDLDGPETEMITPIEYPIAHSLMQLIGLAANIYKVGLNSPISIVETGNHWKISTGERRWLAHHLLRATVGGDDWNKIKAQVVQADVWTQVSENGAREELNAISVARGLALLLMDMYKDDEEYDFIPYEEIINSNDTDQAYYAQAADLRVKRGLGNDVLYATGIKSQGMLYRYRQLLMIPERVWLQADVEDWTEFAIREHVQLLNGKPTKPTPISEPNEGYTSPTVEVSAENENQSDTENGESSQVGGGQQMATPTGVVPSVDRGQALGRGQHIPRMTAGRAEMMSIAVLEYMRSHPYQYEYTNQDEVYDIVTAELRRRGVLDDETVTPPESEPTDDSSQEPVERALESEVPIIAEFDEATIKLMAAIAYASQGTEIRVEDVRLDKLIEDLRSMSLEDVRIMVTGETVDEDLEWYEVYLGTALDAIDIFVHEKLKPFFEHLWHEAGRMQEKERRRLQEKALAEEEE